MPKSLTYYTVYETKNMINGKVYRGVHQTDNLDDGYLGSGNAITNAIKKYGRKNFKKEILFFCESADEMYTKESETVDKEFVSRKDTYNLMTGGLGGRTVSEESRKRRSKSMLGEKHPMHGKNLSDDHKRKLSESTKGRVHSKESIRKTLETKRSRVYPVVVHSVETRRKKSEALKGKPLPIVECSNCGKSGGLPQMKRWHFDNCKHNTGLEV